MGCAQTKAATAASASSHGIFTYGALRRLDYEPGDILGVRV